MAILSSRQKLHVALRQLLRFLITMSSMTGKALLTGYKSVYKIEDIQSVQDSISMHQEF